MIYQNLTFSIRYLNLIFRKIILTLTIPWVTIANPQDLSNSSTQLSIWDGVYTEAQASRGEFIYEGACGFCHGYRLDGAADDPDMRSSPPLARAKFLRDWEGRSLAVLFELSKTTMPEDNPGSLTDQEFVDVIAYMLSVSNLPTGDAELQVDLQSLSQVTIQQTK